MSSSRELAEHFAEMLAPLGGVETKRMFSGFGLSVGEFQFAMIIDDTFYFRVDDHSRPLYEAAGSEPFSYSTKKRRVTVRRYYTAPEQSIDNADQMLDLAEEALAAAQRDDVRKPRKAANS